MSDQPVSLREWVTDDDKWRALPSDAFHAGYRLVDEAVESGADGKIGISPVWYGWALRCAFWSGYLYAKRSA